MTGLNEDDDALEDDDQKLAHDDEDLSTDGKLTPDDQDVLCNDDKNLSKLSREELVDIADDEVPQSENLPQFKATLKDLGELSDQMEEFKDNDEPVPPSIQERFDELQVIADERQEQLIADIEVYRDEYLNPTYGPDEVSDEEGDEDGA